MFRRDALKVIVIGMAAAVLLFLTALPTRAAIEADPASGRQALSDEDPLKKWERLSREEKRELMRKYEFFKSLPESEREVLRQRHRKLKSLRESLNDQDQGPFSGPSGHETRDGGWHGQIKKFLKERIESMKKEIKSMPENGGRDRLERARKFRKRLEHLNGERMGRFLEKMVKEGIVTVEEAEELKAVPHRERKEKLFSLDKERLMRDMKGLLPPDEEDRLNRMEPWRFHRRMQAEQDQWGMVEPASRFGALTPEQEQALQDLPPGPERFQMMRQFIEKNLRSRLQGMGVDRETLDEVFAMPPRERQRWIMKKIRSLKEKNGQFPPELREFLHPHRGRGPHDESGHEGSHRSKRRNQESPRRRH
jgi:hypothetical protein